MLDGKEAYPQKPRETYEDSLYHGLHEIPGDFKC